MEVQAITKFVHISASKARDLARAIQGRKAPDALTITQNSPRKAGFLVGKTLKAAIANAENNAKISAENLVVKMAVVDQGPIHKRFRAGARGSAKPLQKKTSHIKIVLSNHVKAKKA
ncbi:MAG: 50S ribosomal protein L22 [Kiritimatiellae bacterium]|nr:50S ribosomal protein L22 [Kiritimatiellia bacterium]